MPRLELGEYVAEVVTGEVGPRPGLRDPDDAEVPKIRRLAARLEAKYGRIGIGDWRVRGVGLVVFGLRRAALDDIAWSGRLARWVALSRGLAAAPDHEGDSLDARDRGYFDEVAAFLAEVQTQRIDRAPLESVETWAGACARTSERLPPSPEDEARFPRDELVSDRRRLRELWDFLWRAHVGTDRMPAPGRSDIRTVLRSDTGERRYRRLHVRRRDARATSRLRVGAQERGRRRPTASPPLCHEPYRRRWTRRQLTRSATGSRRSSVRDRRESVKEPVDRRRERTREALTAHCTAFIMSKIGRYMLTTMPPTTTPSTTIMIGSSSDSSALTAASTSPS